MGKVTFLLFAGEARELLAQELETVADGIFILRHS